jgi:peptide-methionine (S)-S-oxide reductase
MVGVVRTRVGYAGGTTEDPTYRTIGNHTETTQIDFDPMVVSYEDLLAAFWAAHTPTRPAPSRQYASLILSHDLEQAALADDSRRVIEARLGPVHTQIRPLGRFWVAEDYHQKYRLRGNPVIAREFAGMYPDPADLRESTAAARINGYLDGCGTTSELEVEIASFGLSAEGQSELRRVVGTRGAGPGRSVT